MPSSRESCNFLSCVIVTSISNITLRLCQLLGGVCCLEQWHGPSHSHRLWDRMVLHASCKSSATSTMNALHFISVMCWLSDQLDQLELIRRPRVTILTASYLASSSHSDTTQKKEEGPHFPSPHATQLPATR
jgi:hypothetical protein